MSTWDTVLGQVRAKLVAAGVDTADIYDGRIVDKNWGQTAYVLRPLPERVEERANNLVLRSYPVEIETHIRVASRFGTEHAQQMRDAQDQIRTLFDFKLPGDYTGLGTLRQSRVEVTSKDADPGLPGSFQQKHVSGTATVTFPIWEAA